MKKLTVAIPAYNAEKTLARTVESVLAQTYENLEVIIVNNGSKDGTHDIATKIAELDARVQVLDVYPNIYGYGARLHAWRQATGDYITSVDADDTLSPWMYESMMKVAVEHDLDVVECGYDTRIDGKPTHDLATVEIARGRDKVIDKYVKPVLVDVGLSAYVWNKIYRNQYDFSNWETGTFGNQEDLIHNLQLFRPVVSYGFMPAELYHYLPNGASVTRNFSRACLDFFEYSSNVKRRLAGDFGIAADDLILDRWVINEMKNDIINISTAGNLKDSERPSLIKHVVTLPYVKESMRRYGLRSVAAWVLLACKYIPGSFISRAIRFLKGLRV